MGEMVAGEVMLSLWSILTRTPYLISGIKSMTGHPFGASGALQVATCALAIRRQAVPPTINYEEPDPDCDLDYVPNEAREQKVRLAMGYSLGMGNNAALALATC